MIAAPFPVIRDSALSAWTTTSIASRFLVACLDAAGQPPDDLLARAGLSRGALAAPDAAMALEPFRELWARAAAVQPDIGLVLVDRFPEGQMHVLAHLAVRSATVRAAFADCSRYAGVSSPADRLTLDEDGGVARFGYACLMPGHANPWFAEHYLAMAAAFMARACGRPLPIRAVRFEAPAQAPLAAYVARFGVAPAFEAGATAIDFDAAALDWPLLSHDAYLHAILERVALARRPVADESPLDAVRRAIATRVLEGATPTLDEVSTALKMGPRALRAHLAGFHTTYRQLLDEVRRDLARDHLARGLSVTETAYLLGFSEPAALQHACRRWFGKSAGELRPATG